MPAGASVWHDEAAYAHLLEVICGLDSPMIGETEVLHQFKIFTASMSASHGAFREVAHSLLSDARSNLATTFARQGRPDRAIAELQRVLIDQPENLLARTNLGLLRLEQGRTAEAAREFEAALRVDPAFGPAAEALRSIRGAR